MDLNQYLNKNALCAAIRESNEANLRELRNNVPFHFFNHLKFDIKSGVYSQITDADNNPVAARVTTYDVASNTHTRSDISELVLEKFPIAANRKLTEKQAAILRGALRDAKKTEDVEMVVLKQMFDDVQATKISLWERLEFYFLQLLSTGKIVLDDTTNYSGLMTTIDYNISANNQHQASYGWDNIADADPIGDIKAMVEDANERGFFPTHMYMSTTTFNKMTMCEKFTSRIFTTLTSGATAHIMGLSLIHISEPTRPY